MCKLSTVIFMEDSTVKIGKNVISLNTFGVLAGMFLQTIITTAVIVTYIDKYEARLAAAELRIKDIETGKLKIGATNNNNPVPAPFAKHFTSILFYDNKRPLVFITQQNTTI